MKIAAVQILEKVTLSQTTRKYNITLKLSTAHACVNEKYSTWECRKANAALGFASCCISLSTHPLMLYFSYTRMPVLPTKAKYVASNAHS